MHNQIFHLISLFIRCVKISAFDLSRFYPPPLSVFLLLSHIGQKNNFNVQMTLFHRLFVIGKVSERAADIHAERRFDRYADI